MHRTLAVLLLAAGSLAVSPATMRAQTPKTVRIQIPASQNYKEVTGRIRGREIMLYKVHANNGQFIKVSVRPSKPSAGFNLYVPGKGPGDEALYNSETGGGNEYYGQLNMTGDHTISVFQNRAAARRGDVVNFDVVVTLTSQPQEKSAPKVKTGTAESACLEAVKKQTGQSEVSVISSEMGETSTSVLVRVKGAEKPWRCRWDGRKVLDVMYMGEG